MMGGGGMEFMPDGMGLSELREFGMRVLPLLALIVVTE